MVLFPVYAIRIENSRAEMKTTMTDGFHFAAASTLLASPFVRSEAVMGKTAPARRIAMGRHEFEGAGQSPGHLFPRPTSSQSALTLYSSQTALMNSALAGPCLR